jgi:hypothetical protein
VVVIQLKLYRYLPVDDAGGWLADPLRCFLRANNPTGQEWKDRVSEHLVPSLHTNCSRTPCAPGRRPHRLPRRRPICPARECPTDARTTHHRMRPTIDSDIRPHIFSELCSRRESRQRAHSAPHPHRQGESGRECSAWRAPGCQRAPSLPRRRGGRRPDAERHHAERSAEHPPLSLGNYLTVITHDNTIVPVM